MIKNNALETWRKNGGIPWNKGISGYKTQPASEERKRKISMANKGKKRTPEQIQRIKNAVQGKTLSKEHRKKLSLGMIGKPARGWKGFTITTSGYKAIHKPNHFSSDKRGYVLEHRYIIEKHLNRILQKNEIVHHLNENKLDNRIENLIVFKAIRYHRAFHIFQECLKKGISFYSGSPLLFCVENTK